MLFSSQAILKKWIQYQCTKKLFFTSKYLNFQCFIHSSGSLEQFLFALVRQLEQEKEVQNGDGSKTKKGKARKTRTKEGPRTGVRTSGKTNSTPGQPNLHRPGPGGRRKNTQKKWSQIQAQGFSFLHVFWVSPPSQP